MSAAKRIFEGRTALVIGFDDTLSQSVADYLKRAGATLYLHNSKLEPIRARHDAERVVRLALAESKLDILVHGRPPSSPEHMIDDEANRALSAALVSRAAIPYLQESAAARMVFVASSLGILGSSNHIATAMADAAIVGLARSLALQVMGTNVNVNVITPITSNERIHFPLEAKWPQTISMYTADCVAPVIAYLCHESCDLNGEVITAGAGRIARFVIGTTIGYFNSAPSVADLQEKLPLIMALEHLTYPRSPADELFLIEV
jgi:NAD(P)-dependent dehydrogenase (short-subunit alcohol dehydrogenase family)